MQENRLGGKSDWKTLNGICILYRFQLLIIRYADMDPKLCMTCMILVGPKLKINQMSPDRVTVNASLSKI